MFGLMLAGLFALWDVDEEGLAGDLEAVEEEAGAVDVKLVGGKTDDDFAERVLKSLPICRDGEVEASAGAGVGCGLAAGVVVVTEVFAAEGG